MKISHNYTCIPSLPSLPPLAPSHPSRSSQRARLGSLCYTATSHQLSITHLVVHTDQPQEWSRNCRVKTGSAGVKRRHLVQSSMRVEIMYLIDCWSRVLSISGYINSPGILWQITSNWWVKTTDVYLLMVLEARSLKPRCWQGYALPKASRRDPPPPCFLPPSSGIPWSVRSLPCGSITPTSASIITWSSLCESEFKCTSS